MTLEELSLQLSHQIKQISVYYHVFKELEIFTFDLDTIQQLAKVAQEIIVSERVMIPR